MKKNAAFLLTLFSFIYFVSCKAQDGQKLSAIAFEKEINTDTSIQLLDVRTDGEYKTGHIKNALLADWNNKEEFNRRIAFIDKKKPVYVYCLAGGRSAAAAEKMRTEGFEKVVELTGGMNAWKAAERPVDGKTAVAEMSTEAFNNAINASPVVLVDFGAVWCPPCKKMEPVLQQVKQNLPAKFELVKVDGGNDAAVMKAYNVTALPVFIVFKNGKQVWRRDGIATAEELTAQLK